MSYLTVSPALCSLCRRKRHRIPRVMCPDHWLRFRRWLFPAHVSVWAYGNEKTRDILLERWCREQLLGPEGPS